MEYKNFTPMAVTDEGHGALEGYASTFNNFDSVGERVVKGAFLSHLETFKRDGFIALGHDWASLPVATVNDAYEDDHGLFLRAEFHSTDVAQTARTVLTERMARGKSAKLSIGYEVLRDEITKEGRLLHEVKLYEVSLVNVPANQAAAVTYAKMLPPEGAPLAIYKDAVEAAHAALIREISSLEERRSKAGRMISEANMRVIDSCLSAMETALETLRTLRSAAEPVRQDDQPTKEHAEALALFEQMQALSTKLRI